MKKISVSLSLVACVLLLLPVLMMAEPRKTLSALRLKKNVPDSLSGIMNLRDPFIQGLGALTVRRFFPVDIKDPYIQDLGEFAVNEHNKKEGTNLIFTKVNGGISDGISFILALGTTNGGSTISYYNANVSSFLASFTPTTRKANVLVE